MKKKLLEGGSLILMLLFQLFISFSIPWLNQIIIDEILTQKNFQWIHWVTLIYLLFACFNIALHILLPRMLIKIKEKIVKDLRLRLTESLQKSEAKDFPVSERGNILTLYEQDINQIAQFLSYGMKEVVYQTLSLVVTMIFLLSVEFRIGLFSLCMIPFYMIIPFVFKNKLENSAQFVKEKMSEINEFIQECLSGMAQIRIFNQQASFLKKLDDLSEELIFLKLRNVTIQKYSSATLIIYWLVILSVLWIGGSQVLAGSLTIGVLLVIINYIDRIEWPVTSLVELYGEYQGYLVSKKRYTEVISEKSQLITEATKKINRIDSLVVEDVSYSYGSIHQVILSQLCLEIKKGEKIGIVGASGSGKTTLVKILLGLLEVEKGQILVNQEALSSFDLLEYRRKLAYFTQESYLFEMTLYENILFGTNHEISEKEVFMAAKEAGIHDFIMKLPNSYQTIYGEENCFLSQGQKQRIALARVFLRDADVIIFDEPTSSLDEDTAQHIFTSIQKKYREKIVIVISHDIAKIKGFDKVYHLVNGKLILENQFFDGKKDRVCQ